jgi:hypothetical protein
MAGGMGHREQAPDIRMETLGLFGIEGDILLWYDSAAIL